MMTGMSTLEQSRGVVSARVVRVSGSRDKSGRDRGF